MGELIDTRQPERGTPPWWAARLLKKLADRSGEITLWDSYYEGDHRLAFATEAFLKAFGGLFTHFSDNWCALVADAVEERLTVQGFRMVADGDADPPACYLDSSAADRNTGAHPSAYPGPHGAADGIARATANARR